MRTTALLGLGFALWAGNAQALGPFQVYEQALRNDPEFLAALQERDAGQESRTIGRAGLLPKLSYNYNKGRNNSRATYLNERGNSHEDRNYNSYGSTFTVQQPLIDYEAYANYRKGVAQALFADETFRSKSQELLVRVLTHYTQALFAQDQIDNARAKKNAYEQQFQQNEQLFRQGEGTRTDILEAESRYELATAEQLQAQDDQDAALRELGALIGVATVNIDELTPLPASFSALPLQPASYSNWHTMALESNPLLASQREALEVARYEVERNRAGHLPKLNAYASVRKMESESGLVLLVEDLTETQMLEDKLVHSERLASIGRLAAGVAHEIGNPVTGIACLAQNLREEREDDGELTEISSQILEQTKRISRIVQSLMSFAHAGSHQHNDEPVCLAEVAQDAIGLLALNRHHLAERFDSRLDRFEILPILAPSAAGHRRPNDRGRTGCKTAPQSCAGSRPADQWHPAPLRQTDGLVIVLMAARVGEAHQRLHNA